MTTVATIEGK